jgi:hypothetical protein
MDLSMVRRYSRSDRETGACFRCHKTGHRVRDCQLPDTCPRDVQERDVLTRELRSLHPVSITFSAEPPYVCSRPKCFVHLVLGKRSKPGGSRLQALGRRRLLFPASVSSVVPCPDPPHYPLSKMSISEMPVEAEYQLMNLGVKELI